ncbi:MAG: class I SAM-dependent methyltransferase, partial [Atopobiaceae bacterium]|nr:class I SAM-dependent methyltransferase [Atopobiaceae bacterium]
HASLLSPDATPQQLFGEPNDAETVFLGRDEAQLLAYDMRPRVSLTEIALPTGGRAYALLPSSSQFTSRLTKVARQRRKWARREDITCYRIYDSDLPDYAVSIDLFEGIGGKGRWLQIFEYAPPKEVDPARAQLRLLDVATLAPAILDVRPQDTFVRVRTKAKGGSQYASEAQEVKGGAQRRGKPGSPALPPGAHLVDEGGLTFEVNFSMRLDCGIFLDHRDTRAMLREMTKRTRGSKRFLNLFAYTGTGTCYAADGGAKFTTTVDLSRPSLDWAKRNMERNGFTGPEHEYVQEDVIAWVSKQRRTKNRWDLIFCDVPTFSNSQRMRSSSFDVQRDHAELLIGVSRLLTRDGTCVFSCNLRTFKIDEQALAKAGVEVEDITAQTIPEDFARNPRIHKCYLVRRVAVASTSK